MKIKNDKINNMLPSMDLSVSNNIMHTRVCWCRVVSTKDEALTTVEHRHFVHELHYLYDGCLHFHSNAELFVCNQGDFIFIPANTTHRIEDAAPYTLKLVIGFDVDSQNETVGKAFNSSHTPLCKQETTVFHSLTQALLYKSVTLDLTSSVSVAYIVYTLLLETVDILSANIINRSRNVRELEDSRRVDQIISYVYENVFNNISIDDIAKCVNLSTRQASRICKRLFGCSLNQLVIQIRLKQICNLLIDSQYSISDIAEMSGFSSPYSFSRHFSRFAGVTPSAYRKNYEIHR